MTEIKKVPVKVAAAILGKSEMFVRCIFMEYTGCTAEDIFKTAKALGAEL